MFSDVRGAFGSIRKALTERGGDSSLSRYTVRDDAVYAQSSGMTAVAPCDFFPDQAFAVSASDVDRALDKLAGDVEAVMKDDVLTLRAGRSRVTIKTSSPDHHGISAADIKLKRPPKDLVETIKLLLPFGEAKAQLPWMASIIMRPTYTAVVGAGKIVAVSDVVLGDGLMPLTAAEFLASRGTPKGWGVVDDAIYCIWDDGSWARLSLVAGTTPSILDTLVAEAREAKPAWAVTDEWRGALDRVAALSEGAVTVGPAGLSGVRGASQVDEDVKSGAAEELRFQADYLSLAAGSADAMDLTKSNRIPWRGKKLYGVISTMLG